MFAHPHSSSLHITSLHFSQCTGQTMTPTARRFALHTHPRDRGSVNMRRGFDVGVGRSDAGIGCGTVPSGLTKAMRVWFLK